MKINISNKSFYSVILGGIGALYAYIWDNEMAKGLHEFFASSSVLYAFIFFFLLAMPFFTFMVLSNNKGGFSAEIALWLFDTVFTIALFLTTAAGMYIFITSAKDSSTFGVFIVGLVLAVLAWAFRREVACNAETQVFNSRIVIWIIKGGFITIFFLLPIIALAFWGKIPLKALFEKIMLLL